MALETLSGAARVCSGWMIRRGLLLCGSLMFTLSVPKLMWKSFADHRDGVGFFADPLGKPSLSTYWWNLAGYSYSCFVYSKQPTAEGLAAADNSPTAAWGDDGVKVRDRGDYLEFVPAEGVCADSGGVGKDRPPIGVIILPGAFVSPLAYAPLARTMAQKGFSSFIVRFDFDIALFGWDRTGEIIERSKADGETCDTSPTKWVLVGHSMGTSAIEKFYSGSSEKVAGVVYMGSGNRIGDAMAGVEVPALLLWATRDPICPAEAIEKSAVRLPKDTEKVVIEGGNHRGFASYAWQPLDWEATITQQEQRRIVVESLCDFIERRVAIAT